MYDISPQELIQLLQRLFLNIRKTNGEEYEPDSIKAIQSSIWRHLTDHDYECDIITDPAFRHSRAVVASKHLNEQGLGNKRNRSDPFIKDELAILWHKNLLGAGTGFPISFEKSKWNIQFKFVNGDGRVNNYSLFWQLLHAHLLNSFILFWIMTVPVIWKCVCLHTVYCNGHMQ